jgi:hypothetical protein
LAPTSGLVLEIEINVVGTRDAERLLSVFQPIARSNAGSKRRKLVILEWMT